MFAGLHCSNNLRRMKMVARGYYYYVDLGTIENVGCVCKAMLEAELLRDLISTHSIAAANSSQHHSADVLQARYDHRSREGASANNSNSHRLWSTNTQA